MRQLFSPLHRIGIWRRLWLALAEAQRTLGLPIDESAIEAMRGALDQVDFKKAAEYERRFRHDVMAHVHLFGDAAPAAKGVIHLGATSAFIGDNTDLILHREALHLVRARIVRVLAALSDFAEKHRALPTLGYTHFQPAQPTTVGKRATLWMHDLLMDLDEIEFRLDRLRFRGVKGTTGTQASFLELFDGDGAKVDQLDRLVTSSFGFESTLAVSGQTYSRKIDAALHATLAGIAASLSKFGNDLRLLAHLREVEEPFEEEQIGSSAMPYKRNPMRAERICALSRHVITLVQDPLNTAATQWLERTLDDSANRRLSIPDGYMALDGALALAENVAAGLVVHEAVIEENLARHLPFMAAETVLMQAVASGGDRQELHEKLRRHTLAAAGVMKTGATADLFGTIAADPAFGLDRAALDAIVDPLRFVGRAPDQVDQFLASSVVPVLERLGEESLSLIGEPDIRV